MEILLTIIVILLVGIYYRRYLVTVKGIQIQNFIPENFNFFKIKNRPASKRPNQNLDSKMLFSKAMVYYDRGEMDEAQEILIEVLQMNQNHFEAMHKLGVIYLRNGLFEKAENLFKRLVEEFEDAVYLSNLGRALFEQEKLEEALDIYLKAIRLDDSRAGRFLSVAEVYRALNEKTRVQEMYERAIKLDPSNVDYLLTFAHFFIEENQPTQAKYYLDKVSKLDPENEMAREMINQL